MFHLIVIDAETSPSAQLKTHLTHLWKKRLRRLCDGSQSSLHRPRPGLHSPANVGRRALPERVVDEDRRRQVGCRSVRARKRLRQLRRDHSGKRPVPHEVPAEVEEVAQARLDLPEEDPRSPGNRFRRATCGKDPGQAGRRRRPRGSDEVSSLFKASEARGTAQHRGSIRTSHLAIPGLILGIPEFILMLLRFIDSRTESGQCKKLNSCRNLSSTR